MKFSISIIFTYYYAFITYIEFPVELNGCSLSWYQVKLRNRSPIYLLAQTMINKVGRITHCLNCLGRYRSFERNSRYRKLRGVIQVRIVGVRTAAVQTLIDVRLGRRGDQRRCTSVLCSLLYEAEVYMLLVSLDIMTTYGGSMAPTVPWSRLQQKRVISGQCG